MGRCWACWLPALWRRLPGCELVGWVVGVKKCFSRGAFGLALILLAYGLFASGQLDRLVGAVPDPTGSLVSRAQIWRQGLPLIRDYFFTGAGLASFPIVFSIYRLLIHVPFHEHLHNIFLETWYEQGILGLAAMLWGMLVVLRWAWEALTPSAGGLWNAGYSRQSSLRTLGWAGMAALVTMGVHGMVDVVFMVKPSLPLVGLVIGFASLVNALDRKAEIEAGTGRVEDEKATGPCCYVCRGGAAAGDRFLPSFESHLVSLTWAHCPRPVRS